MSGASPEPLKKPLSDALYSPTDARRIISAVWKWTPEGLSVCRTRRKKKKKKEGY